MQEDLIFSLNYKLQFTGRLWENIPGTSLYLHLHNRVHDQVSVSQLVMGWDSAAQSSIICPQQLQCLTAAAHTSHW